MTTTQDLPVTLADLEDGIFTLRAVDPEADLATVHAWMNDPQVARFWELAEPAEKIGAYLRGQLASSYSTPYIGCLDGAAMSYWELYRADLDPLLTGRYDALPHDVGVHLLLGPSDIRGRGLGADLLRAVSGWALERFPDAQRVLAEPDVRNVRSVRVFERAGFRRVGEVDLTDKRAALMVRERTA
ncbi:MAG TPA: GNAT family N-acetyltransferase [Streptomyces sp.]|nr:GNAT family N-acetyltransferase [Streptomyces sp.]